MDKERIPFDLCGDSFTFDIETLYELAAIAVRYSLDDLHRTLGKWNEIGNIPNPVYSEKVATVAKHLSLATQAEYYLSEARSREFVEVKDKKPLPRWVGNVPPCYVKYDKIRLIKHTMDKMALGIPDNGRLKWTKELIEEIMGQASVAQM